MDRDHLVREHGPGIYTICRRLCPDPEDAYQAVWARVFAALPGFDPNGAASLRTWIFAIAHRHLVDRHRRRSVRDRHAADHPHAEGRDDATAERAFDRRQRKARLDDAIDALAPELGRVVVLHHLAGVPIAQIATDEGVAVGTVKSRLHRARAQLANRLADLAPDHETPHLRVLAGDRRDD